MHKKAVSPELMVVLFAFLIVAMILLTFSEKLTSLFKEDADIETCRLSVLAQAQARKIPGVGIDTPGTTVSLDCPRRVLKIFENKVEVNGKKSKKYDFKKISDNEVNHILAEELRLCWYRMAEGNSNIFEYTYIGGDANTCLICAEIEFEDKLKGNSYGGLLEYLKTRKMQKINMTYFDYLIRSQANLYFLWGWAPWTQYTPWGYGTTQRDFEDKFLTNQKYSVYFLAYKPSWLAQFTKTWTKAYYIGLGKESKIQEECAILVN